jgi:hypothetical protein
MKHEEKRKRCNSSCFILHSFEGGVAQMGERLPCKQEVSGSNPLVSMGERASVLRDEEFFDTM